MAQYLHPSIMQNFPIGLNNKNNAKIQGTTSKIKIMKILFWLLFLFLKLYLEVFDTFTRRNPISF